MADEIRSVPSKKIKDISGQKFGHITVLGFVGQDPKTTESMWLCECVCGTKLTRRGGGIRDGGIKSCGCKKAEMIGQGNTKHGDSFSDTYESWRGMRDRCLNPDNSAWDDYGGRGISICERWSDYLAFKEDMGERPEGLTIDRINVNGNYEPGNCRWATMKAQSNNRRNNVVLTHDGKTMTLAQWSEFLGVSHGALSKRIKLGWPVDRVLSSVVRPY
jgi:hypothetical protein